MHTTYSGVVDASGLDQNHPLHELHRAYSQAVGRLRGGDEVEYPVLRLHEDVPRPPVVAVQASAPRQVTRRRAPRTTGDSRRPKEQRIHRRETLHRDLDRLDVRVPQQSPQEVERLLRH